MWCRRLSSDVWGGGREKRTLSHVHGARALLRARCYVAAVWIAIQIDLSCETSPVQTPVSTDTRAINHTLQLQVEDIVVDDGARQQSTQRRAELGLQGLPLHQGVPGPPVFQPRPLRHRRRLRAARRAHVRGARGRIRAAAKGQHQTLPRRLPQGTLANYRCIH